MSIRTLSTEEPYPGVTVVLVEVTEPGEDKRLVYEVHCEHCDSFDADLTATEAQAALAEHTHHIEKGQE